MEFIKISKNEFSDIYKIMEEAFPDAERRQEAGQMTLFDDPLYSIVANKNKTIFIAFWQLNNYMYIEHFATAASERGNGLGSRFLQAFIEKNKMPVALEVEPPNNEIEKRRVMFYEREGFVLNDYYYMQPPMEEGKNEVELKIMTYPKQISQDVFEELRDEIYKKVYKVK